MHFLKHLEWKWTVPNALSLVRLLLLPLFVYLFLQQGKNYLYCSIGVLVFSGLTDAADGWIARRFNQETPIGKLLDPLADKCTQVTVVICVALKYTVVMPLAIICFIKEVIQVIGGVMLLRKGVKPQSARWFGKLATVAFYVAMAAIILFPGMPAWLFAALIVAVALWMAFAFAGYVREYCRIRKNGFQSDSKE